MYTKNKEYKIYLYILDDDIFYWSDEEKANWLISTTNFNYIDRVVSLLNKRKYDRKINNLGHLTMGDILETIVTIAFAQDTDCHIQFNDKVSEKENNI